MTPDDLSGAALNRAIAERLGWRDLHMRYGLVWGCDPNDDSGHVIQPPNWANDTGAALALCMEIAVQHAWEVSILPLPLKGVASSPKEGCDAGFYPFFGWEKSSLSHIFSATGEKTALALARLALAALSAEPT